MKSVDLDELKKIQLSILRQVDVFCDENNIEYCLMYGSLIGAIRHKGIIPWDDDIDICMTRDNYNRFLELFPSSSSSEFYVREQTTEHDFPFYYAKICKSRTHAYEIIDSKKYDIGINIDLFPLDPIPNDIRLRKRILRKIQINKIKLIPHTIAPNKKRLLIKRLIICILGTIYRKPAYYYTTAIRRIVFFSKKQG